MSLDINRRVPRWTWCVSRTLLWRLLAGFSRRPCPVGRPSERAWIRGLLAVCRDGRIPSSGRGPSPGRGQSPWPCWGDGRWWALCSAWICDEWSSESGSQFCQRKTNCFNTKIQLPLFMWFIGLVYIEAAFELCSCLIASLILPSPSICFYLEETLKRKKRKKTICRQI